MKENCGKFTEDQVRDALDNTRMTEENQEQMVNFFVRGIRLKDLGISKQAATPRLKATLALMVQ
jgi:hypothetical protein